MTITYNHIRANITPVRGETKTSPVVFHLQANAVLSLNPTGHGITVQSASGELWLTQQGDPADYFLEPGETFTPERSGLIVVQAMQEATVRIFE